MLRTRISHAVAGAAAPRVSTIPGVPEATPKLQVPVAPGCWPLLGHAPAFLAWQHFQRGGGGGDFAAALRAFRTATGSPTFAFVAPGWSREHIVVTADAALSQQFLLHQGQFPVREYDHVWAPIFERRGWTSNAVVWAHGESWKRLRHVMNNTLAQLTRMEPYFGPIEDASRRFTERYLPNHLAPPTEAVTPNVPAAERDDANAGGFAVRGDLQDLFSATFVEAMIPTLFGLRVEPLVGSISASPQQQRSTIRVTPASGSSDFAIDVPTDHFARLRRAVMATLELTQRVQAKRWIAQRNPFDADYAALCSMFDDIYACLCTLWDPLVAFYQRHGRWPAGVDAAVIAKLYAQVENRELSEPEAVWVLGFALAAGGDTTAQSFENVLHALAVSPLAQHKLANEIAIMSQQHRDNISYAVVAEESPYLRATIKESLRLCPVIAAHLRVTTKDFSYSSSRYAAPIVIPTGSKVVIDYGAIARDPLAVVGPQPSLAFAPDRFLRSGPAALQHTTGGSSRNRGCPRRQEADEDANTAYAADTSVQAVAAGAGRCPYHHHPAATLAFGHGPRKCPGGGFATLLLLCLTRDVVARYELQSTHRVGHSDRIPLHSRRGPMRPTEPVAGKLRFIPRAPQPEHK